MVRAHTRTCTVTAFAGFRRYFAVRRTLESGAQGNLSDVYTHQANNNNNKKQKTASDEPQSLVRLGSVKLPFQLPLTHCVFVSFAVWPAVPMRWTKCAQHTPRYPKHATHIKNLIRIDTVTPREREREPPRTELHGCDSRANH